MWVVTVCEEVARKREREGKKFGVMGYEVWDLKGNKVILIGEKADR